MMLKPPVPIKLIGDALPLVEKVKHLGNKLQSDNEMKEEFVLEKYSKSECISKVSSQKLCKTNGIHPGKVRNLKLNPSFKGKISRCVFCKSKCHCKYTVINFALGIQCV